ncbi:uncharacterized protein LOC106085419 [Stomoxys calcitrans]|uniref:uncharacterized protein LOC106085419 n=1 Tax=Stomoxys calcitrans TaxID=35570 RepID=UPI0027E30C20|nr:uncharacterized protein LOC106085419 [Stomoxys calcitrans]
MAEEITSKCRTCMNQLFNFYQIYDYVDESNRIVDMLDVVVPQIRIKEAGNSFSHLMCQMCVDKLITGYKFQRLCIETDNHLRCQLGVAPLAAYMKSDALIDTINTCELRPATDSGNNVKKAERVTEISNTNTKFECSDCGKVFDCMSRLKGHSTLHRNKKEKEKALKDQQNKEQDEANGEKDINTVENIVVAPQIYEKSSEYVLNTEALMANKINTTEESNEKNKTDEDVSSPSKIKKRKRKEETWKKNVLKTARNSGKSYVSHTPEKKVRSERKVKPPCLDSCKLKCTTKLNENERNTIFSNFWKLANLEKQRQYIANNTEPITPKYRYVRGDGSRKPRIMNNAFYFRLGEKKIRVCKLFFKNTLDINDRNITTVLLKKHKVADTILEEDKRGKHGNHPRLDESIRDGVRNYISNMLKTESISYRPYKTKHFIDGTKSISGFYKDYLQSCEQKNVASTNYTLFYRIFKEEFNITFLQKETKKKATSHSKSTTKVEGDDKTHTTEKYDQNIIMNLLYNN